MYWLDETTYLCDESSYGNSASSGSLADSSENESLMISLCEVTGFGAVTGTCGGLSSTSGDESGSNPAITTGESTSNLANLYGGGAGGATTGIAVAGSVGGSLTSIGAGIDCTTPDPDTIIELRNNAPYSRVEKRAEAVYATLHGIKEYTPTFPVIIAETQEKLEAIYHVFGHTNPELIAEKLEIIKRLLDEAEEHVENIS